MSDFSRFETSVDAIIYLNEKSKDNYLIQSPLVRKKYIVFLLSKYVDKYTEAEEALIDELKSVNKELLYYLEKLYPNKD